MPQEPFSTEDAVVIARQLAATPWKPEQLTGVATLTASLLDGVNRLAAHASHDDLPAVEYRLPEWE